MRNEDFENFLPTLSGIEPNWTCFEEPDFEELIEEEDRLEDAMPLTVYSSACPKIRSLVNDLFKEIAALLPIRNTHRIKECIKTVVLNLWQARWMELPVRYSRKKAFYSRHRRYGQLHFKYRRMVQIIDALDSLGHLKQKPGFFVPEKGFGRQTRMWGTEKLWALFEHHGVKGTNFIKVPEPEEVIELRSESNTAGKIDYAETAETLSMRSDLIRYNDFVSHHAITVHLHGDVEVSNRFLLHFLQPNILNNTITIEAVIPAETIPQPITYNKTSNNSTTSNLSPYYSFYSMTGTKTDDLRPPRRATTDCEWLLRTIGRLRKQLQTIGDTKDRKTFLEKRVRLKDLGVEFLMIRLVKESLHRVFNRGSFDCNGRAYGALHQKLPKELRPFIFIDGKPTVELDFGAYHILMLYHLQGIDYLEDPYTACGGPEMRKAFKIASLIGINAPTMRKAYHAIRAKFEEENIPLPMVKRPLKYLIETFKAKHQPVAHAICSDAGIKLQNIDSHIMNSILMRLMDLGILGLSVYDSVIVAEEFSKTAKAVMIEEYERVFGFKPRV